MNDIAKAQTQIRLVKAMEHESLKVVEAAQKLGILSNYISMIKNEKTWDQCPLKAWEAVLTWINSGQSLKEYGDKHGKILPEKHIELPPKVIAVKQPEAKNMEVRVKPEALERREREIEEKKKRATKGELIDMLIQEKEFLKSKIDAIDVLLKHYIS